MGFSVDLIVQHLANHDFTAEKIDVWLPAIRKKKRITNLHTVKNSLQGFSDADIHC